MIDFSHMVPHAQSYLKGPLCLPLEPQQALAAAFLQLLQERYLLLIAIRNHKAGAGQLPQDMLNADLYALLPSSMPQSVSELLGRTSLLPPRVCPQLCDHYEELQRKYLKLTHETEDSRQLVEDIRELLDRWEQAP